MENTLRQKGLFFHREINDFGSQNRPGSISCSFCRQNRKNRPKRVFGRQSVIFMENERFLGSEALISCPSRQPCSRQWFLWCFGAHFHPFRTFSLFFALFPPKATFAPKSGFGRKSAFSALLGPFWGHFCTLPRTLL